MSKIISTSDDKSRLSQSLVWLTAVSVVWSVGLVVVVAPTRADNGGEQAALIRQAIAEGATTACYLKTVADAFGAITNALASATAAGKAGEGAISSTLTIPKNTSRKYFPRWLQRELGTKSNYIVPDFWWKYTYRGKKVRAILESKNVAKLALTGRTGKQLRALAYIAKRTGRTLVIITGKTTEIAPRLAAKLTRLAGKRVLLLTCFT
jgi:hypothetical protein